MWRALRRPRNYGLAVGRPDDLVILDAQSPKQAVAEISQPLAACKGGRQTVARALPQQ
jgi:cytosine deaminase